jgi:diphosphomevalonate decarboxylase
MKKVIVQANANIALIKYWGKRDTKLFLPTKSSLSITLDHLKTITQISFCKQEDKIWLDNQLLVGAKREKIVRFLNLFRIQYQVRKFFKIISYNNFPTAAGLASSSSGFAALAKGLNKACALKLGKKELSILARCGSGSACRSLYDGFVLWHKGEKEDGSDSYATRLFKKSYWPEFCVLVCVVDGTTKKISSRDAMQNTIYTSPLYDRWVQDSEKRIEKIKQAIQGKDFSTVGRLAERDCVEMHRTMHMSQPSINYMQASTKKIINAVKKFRKQGIECYFTIDAGPNVKILCKKEDVSNIRSCFLNVVACCSVYLGFF